MYENSGNTAAALTILEQLAGVFSAVSGQYHEVHFFDYIRLLCEEGEWGLALIYLQEYVQANQDDYGARYLLGLTGLEFSSPDILDNQTKVLAELQARQHPAQHYAYALQAAIAEQKGDAEAAAENYLAAIESVDSSRLKYGYIMSWAQVRVESNPREVAAALQGYLEEYDLAGIRSLLAYALVKTDPESATRHAIEDSERNGYSFLVNLYAGAALTRAGNYAEGLDLLTAADVQRPARQKVLTYLKRAYLGTGDDARARKTSDTLEYLVALAKGEADEVQVSYKIHLPENEDLVKAVQDMVRGSGNYGDVQEAYAIALGRERNTKKRAEILYSKATFESYNKTYDRAAGLFKRAVQMGLPNQEMQVQAILFYFEVLQLTERHQEAHRVVDAIIALDGEKLLYRRMRGEVFDAEGKEREALETYLALIDDYPTDVQSYYRAADLHIALEETQEALALLRRMLFISPPGDPRPYELLAKAYRIFGNTDKSVQYSNAFSFLEGLQRGG